MNIEFLLFFILLTIIIGFLSVMIFGYTFYYMHLYYKTSKYRLYSVWPIFVVSVIFFILMIVAFVLQYGNKADFFVKNPYVSYYSLLIGCFCLAICLTIWLLKNKINETPHSITNFYEEDFEKQIEKIRNTKNFSEINKKYSTSSSKFILRMNQKSSEIIGMMENGLKFEEVFFQTIKFNEEFTPKFSCNTANYHLYLFLNLCLRLQSKQI